MSPYVWGIVCGPSSGGWLPRRPPTRSLSGLKHGRSSKGHDAAMYLYGLCLCRKRSGLLTANLSFTPCWLHCVVAYRRSHVGRQCGVAPHRQYQFADVAQAAQLDRGGPRTRTTTAREQSWRRTGAGAGARAGVRAKSRRLAGTGAALDCTRKSAGQSTVAKSFIQATTCCNSSAAATGAEKV